MPVPGSGFFVFGKMPEGRISVSQKREVACFYNVPQVPSNKLCLTFIILTYK